MSRIYKLLAAAVIAAAAFVPGLAAAQIMGGHGNKTTYIAGGQTVNDDLYVTGNSVEIDGTVNGDVYAAGQTITITGTVNGDVFAAGQSVKVSGKVSGSVRAAGSSVRLAKAAIGGSASAFGQDVQIDSDAVIGGGLNLFAATAQIDGKIARGITGAGSNLTINGPVGKDVAVGGDAIRVGNKADISGKLVYRSKNNAEINGGAHISGRTEHIKETKHAGRSNAQSSAFGVLWMIVSLFLIGALMLWMAPTATNGSAASILSRPWVSLGLGFASLILTPIVLLLVAFTVIGLPLAIIGLVLYVVALFLAAIPTALAIAAALYRGQARTPGRYWLLLIGLVILALLEVIPYVGPVVRFLSLLFGLGGFTAYLWVRQPRGQHRKSA